MQTMRPTPICGKCAVLILIIRNLHLDDRYVPAGGSWGGRGRTGEVGEGHGMDRFVALITSAGGARHEGSPAHPADTGDARVASNKI